MPIHVGFRPRVANQPAYDWTHTTVETGFDTYITHHHLGLLLHQVRYKLKGGSLPTQIHLFEYLTRKSRSIWVSVPMTALLQAAPSMAIDKLSRFQAGAGMRH